MKYRSCRRELERRRAQMGTEVRQTSAGLCFDCVEGKMQSCTQTLHSCGLEKFGAVGPYSARRGRWLHVGLLLPTPPGGVSQLPFFALSRKDRLGFAKSSPRRPGPGHRAHLGSGRLRVASDREVFPELFLTSSDQIYPAPFPSLAAR